MTLVDMANFVCRKVRATDDAAVARCKEFLQRRYEMLWDEALWRDTIYQATISAPASGVGAAPNDPVLLLAGVLFLPALTDRVLGVRTTDNEVTVTAAEGLVRITPDAFELTGRPAEYYQMGPAVAQTIAASNFQLFATAADAGQVVRCYVIDSNQQPQTIDVTLVDGAVDILAGDSLLAIDRLSKPTTAGAVVLLTAYGGEISCPASATNWTALQRLRLVPAPTDDTTFKVLLKRKLIPMEDDNDEPALRNCTNLLLAAAHADLLEYQRQYGKAQAKFQEAGALVEQFKRAEAVQEAQRQQIMPEVSEVSGSVESSWGFSGKGYW